MKSGMPTENLKENALRISVAAAVLALLPVNLFGRIAALGQEPQTRPEAQRLFAQDEDARAFQDQDQVKRERDDEAREREQERSDREQERAQEKKDREQERLERLEELYDDGREALDDEHYQQAEKKFDELIKMNGPQSDAALYWKAYAQNKQGKRDAALATIANLKARFAQSRWKKDAEALEIEVRQGTGTPVDPGATADADLKALALQGIMNSDPQRAIPLIEKNLNSASSPKEKAKYLFVLAQNGSPQAQEVLARIARGQGNPDLQRRAVEYLAMYGGSHSGATLAEIYASSNDSSVKRAVIRGYLMSGDHEHLLAIAKSEKDEELKREAIRTLGMSGGRSDLQQLYQTEASTDAKKDILQALFLCGDPQGLGKAAQSEKNPELRREAVRNLGLLGGRAPELESIYAHETDRGVKEEVLNAYFIGGNAKGLIAIAKTEKDPGLKKEAVEKLSLMGSKEANDYLMEILQK
jgi:HEAT repeats